MKKTPFAFLILFALLSSCSVKQRSEKTVRRIVSLGPSATEILFAIHAEDKIVARTDLCDYPEEAARIKSVGGFAGNTVSLESVLLCEPDFVYLFSGMHDHLIAPLQKLGITVFVSDASSVADVQEEIRAVGKITGHEEDVRNVVSRMNEKLETVSRFVEQKTAAGKNIPSVYWEVWNSPLMSVGKNSFINDIIQKAGGKNIFENENSAYPVVNEEAVILAHPDFIFFTGDGTASGSVWRTRRGWNISEENIFYVGDDVTFVRPSPRCVDAVEKLSKILWGGE